METGKKKPTGKSTKEGRKELIKRTACFSSQCMPCKLKRMCVLLLSTCAVTFVQMCVPVSSSWLYGSGHMACRCDGWWAVIPGPGWNTPSPARLEFNCSGQEGSSVCVCLEWGWWGAAGEGWWSEWEIRGTGQHERAREKLDTCLPHLRTYHYSYFRIC